ncbi:MAG: hypothetical protein ACREFP_00510, partial [Acetobacteraceae bacterium]
MALALDGSALLAWEVGGTVSGALTTTQADDVIVVVVFTSNFVAGTVLSVSDAADPTRTWTLRASSAPGSYALFEFWAVAGSPLASDEITVTSSGGNTYNWSAMAFGVAGADTSAPFDMNAVLPVLSTAATTIAVSTAADNAFIFGAYGCSGTGAAGAGWTSIQNDSGYHLAECATFTSPQTNLVIPLSAGTPQYGALGDAIVAAGSVTNTTGAARTHAAAAGRIAASAEGGLAAASRAGGVA